MSASAIDVDAGSIDLFDLDGPEVETTRNEAFAEASVTADQAFGELASSEEVTNVNAAANSNVVATTADATTAEPAAYAEYIVLNGEDNDAILEDNGNLLDDLVQLRSVNGTFETIVFRLPTHQLVIDLGAGTDSLTVSGLELGTLTADVFINGQEGNDSITLNSLKTLNNVYVQNMDGDNSLTARQLEVGGNFFINDGDGNHTVSIGGTIEGDVNIGSTDGESVIRLGDRAALGYGQFGGSVVINSGGEGLDKIELTGLISDDFYIDAGDGDFKLSSIFSSVRGALFTTVDNGDSTIFLGDFSAGEDSYFMNHNGDTDTWLTATFFGNGLTIQNGLGFDELRLDGTKISTGGSEPGLLTVNNGDGGSSTLLNQSERLFSLWIGEFYLHNGLGTDTIDFNIRERDLFGTFHANNGDGDMTIEISGNSTIDSLTLLSGEGNDQILIDEVRIQNDLVIDTGLGDRNIEVEGADVQGNTDISAAIETATVYGSGDDEIFASLGNNIIDGGNGDDVLVVYEGVREDYTITYEADGRVIVEGPGLNGTTVRNELTNVERILFNDGPVSLNSSGTDESPLTVGTDGDDWISLQEPGGNVEAGDGDDFIYAPFGELNEIDGGAGTDTLVIYEGVQSDYIIRRPSASLLVEIEGPGLNRSKVTHRLTDVEYILFNDGLVQIADLEVTQETV